MKIHKLLFFAISVILTNFQWFSSYGKSVHHDTLTLGKGTDFNKEFAKTNKKGWYGNEEFSPVDGIVTTINLNTAKPGIVIFGIGLIDQNNIFILEREFIHEVKSGLNNISINESIKSGQQIFIKTPVSGICYKSGSNRKIYYTENGYNSALSIIPKARLAFSYQIIPNKKVADNQNITQQKLSKKSSFKNTLIIGNSITKHGLAPFWWGNWGMAASRPDKDFVHILISLLREQNASMSYSVLQASKWERDHQHFALSSYDSIFSSKPDLVILRLGENVLDLQDYEQSYLRFLNYIKQEVPEALVVATGNFWTNELKDIAMKKAADSAGIIFVSLSDLDTKENKSSIGTLVTGEDGLEHKIDHNGVANHPGDTGMKSIAYRIFENLP